MCRDVEGVKVDDVLLEMQELLVDDVEALGDEVADVEDVDVEGDPT